MSESLCLCPRSGQSADRDYELGKISGGKVFVVIMSNVTFQESGTSIYSMIIGVVMSPNHCYSYINNKVMVCEGSDFITNPSLLNQEASA